MPTTLRNNKAWCPVNLVELIWPWLTLEPLASGLMRAKSSRVGESPWVIEHIITKMH